ncbi:MAG: hypothetical protein EBT95_07850 [Verrucomicrobia bacterium]|nr:hypothetical protein [Verrucomicrobiota bacterium]
MWGKNDSTQVVGLKNLVDAGSLPGVSVSRYTAGTAANAELVLSQTGTPAIRRLFATQGYWTGLIDKDGKIWAWGNASTPTAAVPVAMASKVVQAVGGGNFALALVLDQDGDGLADNVETNTGIYVSADNTGTDPARADTDGDGLNDGVETRTGTFVSASNTGTDPLLADTDGDGTSDGVEVAAGKDPNVAPRTEIRLAAMSTGYVVSARRSNTGELDFSTTSGSVGVGMQRSANGSADSGNQRAGVGFATFQLPDLFLKALGKPGAKFYVELKVDGIGAGAGGVPYTDGLDLRFYGVRDSGLNAFGYYNSSAVGSDQADIVATTASPGVKKVELTQAQAVSQIGAATAGKYVGFGFLNSAGVNTSVPVGNSFAETYSFNLSAVPADSALVVSLPDLDQDGLADASSASGQLTCWRWARGTFRSRNPI